ncbi:MAG: hypothetical protein HFF90_07395 [Oscillibacter sp.]|nr:hypothetical protein [Oscillibacter sp.]
MQTKGQTPNDRRRRGSCISVGRRVCLVKAGDEPESTKPDAALPDTRRDCLAEAGDEPESTKPDAHHNKIQEVHTMTERMIENRVNKLRQLEAQQKQLEEQAEAIRAELKAHLEQEGLEELRTKNFILRWKEIISSRLDGKALKAALPDVYGQFCRSSTSRRFTISA